MDEQSATEIDDLLRPRPKLEKERRHHRRVNGHRSGKRHIHEGTSVRDEARSSREKPDGQDDRSPVGAADGNGITSESRTKVRSDPRFSLETDSSSESQRSHQSNHLSRYHSSHRLTASEDSPEESEHPPISRVASDAPARAPSPSVSSSLANKPLVREFDFERPGNGHGIHSSRNIENDFDPRRPWSPARPSFGPSAEDSDEEDPDVSTNVLEVRRITHRLENVTADEYGTPAHRSGGLGIPPTASEVVHNVPHSNTVDRQLPTESKVSSSSAAEWFPDPASVSPHAPRGGDRPRVDGIQTQRTGYQSAHARPFKPDQIAVNVGSVPTRPTAASASVFVISNPVEKAESAGRVRSDAGSIANKTDVSRNTAPSSASIPRTEISPPTSNRTRLATLHLRGMAHSGHLHPNRNHPRVHSGGPRYQPQFGHNLSQASSERIPLQHNELDYFNQFDRLPPGVSIHPRHPQAPFADMVHSNRPPAMPLNQSHHQFHHQFHHRQRHHRKRERVGISCCSHRGKPGSANQWSLCCSRTFGTVPSSGPSCCSSPGVVPPVVGLDQSDAPFRSSSHPAPGGSFPNQQFSRPPRIGNHLLRSPTNREEMLVRSSDKEVSYPIFNRIRPTAYYPSNHEVTAYRTSNQETPYPAFNRVRPTSYSHPNHGRTFASSSHKDAFYPASNRMHSVPSSQGRMFASSSNQDTSNLASYGRRATTYYPANHEGMLARSSNQGASYHAPYQIRPASYSPSNYQGPFAWSPSRETSYHSHSRVRPAFYSPSNHGEMGVRPTNQGTFYPTTYGIRPASYSPPNHDGMRVRSSNGGTFYLASDRAGPFGSIDNAPPSAGYEKGNRCDRVKVCRTLYESTQKVIVCRNAHVEGC